MTVCRAGCERYDPSVPCCRWDGLVMPPQRGVVVVTDPEKLRKLATVFDEPERHD